MPKRWLGIFGFCLAVSLSLFSANPGLAASWTPLTNMSPAGSLGTMVLLTDGTVIMLSGDDSAHWLKLTPDTHGSYVNGTWTTLAPMVIPRLYFASQVLPNGNLWVLGGEYTGPYYDANIAASDEIYDTVANSWSLVTPYPSQSGCGTRNVTSDVQLTAGSTVITGIYSTDRMQVGWTVTGTGIPSGAKVTSVDSATQVHISNAATATGPSAAVVFRGPVVSCFGDDPSILIPGGNILAGNIFNNSTFLYSIASDSWSLAAKKFYNDRSDEEGWTKMGDGSVLTYDLFRAVATGTGYAELYNPSANIWTGITPADGTANGTLPVLSSGALGEELGPVLRLQDGRALVIGANQHTALYTPSTNTWAAGPDVLGTLSNPFGTINNALFGADDAPAALLPNGHVMLAADAGPNPVTSVGNTTAGSPVVTNIPSTAGLQPGWAVAQSNGKTTSIPSGDYIASVDSVSQITLGNNNGSAAASATTTAAGLGLVFGGIFSNPTQLFDFDPTAGTLAPVSPAIPDDLSFLPAYIARMLVLPNGQLLFNDGNSNQLWIYTPDGTPNPSLRPVVNKVAYSGAGVFALTGQQLNGQSNGSAYGDDVQSDENYPIVRLASPNGNVYYCRTTNWSSTSVAGGSTPETVNFTLNPAVKPGNYILVVSGSGITSFPVFVNISQAEVNGQ